MIVTVAKVTIKDVAIAAGVSPSTVSNFFNHSAKLAAPTRHRIQKAIGELGFVPNEAARRLRAGTNPVVGYIAFELASAFTPAIADTIEREVAKHGMYLLMANDHESSDREMSYVELFEMQRVSGIIVAPLGDIEGELIELKRRGTPSVISARAAVSPSLASVSVDNVMGGYLAVDHLIAQGRTHIAFISSSPELKQLSDRLHGALRAVGEHGGVTFEVVQVAERTITAGATAARDIASRAEHKRPDGVFCANDLLAIGFIQQLRTTTSIRVPQDIAVIGYDDNDFATSATIPLSSIRVSPQYLGTTAVELLFEEMSLVASAAPGELPEQHSRHVLFDPELVARASTTGA